MTFEMTNTRVINWSRSIFPRERLTSLFKELVDHEHFSHIFGKVIVEKEKENKLRKTGVSSGVQFLRTNGGIRLGPSDLLTLSR